MMKNYFSLHEECDSDHKDIGRSYHIGIPSYLPSSSLHVLASLSSLSNLCCSKIVDGFHQ